MKTQSMYRNNGIVYKEEHDLPNNMRLVIKVSLNDECNNGHQDFSITGTLFKGKKDIAGGCIHDIILKYRPEFKVFVNLHLANYEGFPLYGLENGYYFLENGFDKVPRNSPEFKKEFCNYYLIDEDKFKYLELASSEKDYRDILIALDCDLKWKEIANEAIKLLESLSNLKFVPNSKKRYIITEEERKLCKEKLQSGYFTIERKKQIERDRYIADKKINLYKLRKRYENKVLENYIEYILELFLAINDLPQNVTYYSHTNEIKFNWTNKEKELSQEQINFIAKRFGQRVKRYGVKINT